MCDTLDPQLKVRLFGTEDDRKVDKSTSDEQVDRLCPSLHKEFSEKAPKISDQCERTFLWPDRCLKIRQKLRHSRSNFSQFQQRNVNFSHNFINLHILLVLVLITFNPTDACSSRSTPKPRPPSQSAIRPNITFQTYACPPTYAAWYCLNGATCFTVKIADSILYNCECADGFMGQRCEFKDLDGSYLPTRERLMQLKNSALGQALLLVLTVVISIAIISAIITKWRLKNKLKNSNNNNNIDDLDSNETNPSTCARYSMSSSTRPTAFPFTISSHCDVIRGYNLGSSVIRNNDSDWSNSRSQNFNYRYQNSISSLATESRQRAYSNFAM